MTDLGLPAMPAPVLAPRRRTRQIKVGKVGVGSESPVSVQSMTTTRTTEIDPTLQQIAELTAAGCDIVRVACPSQDDAAHLLGQVHHGDAGGLDHPAHLLRHVDRCAAREGHGR